MNRPISVLAQQIIDGYNTGLCGLDNHMLDLLVELGDQAQGILDMERALRAINDMNWLDKDVWDNDEAAAAKALARKALGQKD